MSTKIDDGIRFEGLESIEDLHALCTELRSELKELAEERIRVFMVRAAIRLHDDYMIGVYKPNERDLKYSPLFHALDEYQTRAMDVERTKERDPEIDMSCEISIHPIPGKVLGIVYCEQPEFRHHIIGKDCVTEYAYWNNTDPSEKCSEEEWQQRREDWDKALPGIGIPAQNGFTAQIVETRLLPDLELMGPAGKCDSYIKEYTSIRYKRMASALYRDRYVNANLRLTDKSGYDRILMRCVQDFYHWIRYEGRPQIDRTIQWLMADFPPITGPDLRDPLENIARHNRADLISRYTEEIIEEETEEGGVQ